MINLLSIEGGIRTFFSSLSASLSFDIILYIGLGIQILLILFFAVKSSYSYEMRTVRALDRLNKWLFVNKKITSENIKEFTNMIKRSPKRLSYNWQQYILFREKAPSQYLTSDNIIEKPLKSSSIKANVSNFVIFSMVWSFVVFLVCLGTINIKNDTITASDLLVSLIIPIINVFIMLITSVILRTKRNYNLDDLYQNHHLFQRFVDNACIDLPQYIDFVLLFTKQEIERGIPALREFLETRARQEKEAFEKAQREAVVYEKYNFEKSGVDGSNILERAMNESEAFLSNKGKALAKISQLEASLESLKQNFDNIQKDFQKKMQVSKENIDRLRQQQVETTSRIESNFLRKQQATEIAKQEREEGDFDQQKRRYLIEKQDYEEGIKDIQKTLEEDRQKVEDVMLSEYESFFDRICKGAEAQVEEKAKEEFLKLSNEKDSSEDELEKVQVELKRAVDENEVLKSRVIAIASEDNGDRKRKKVKFDEAEIKQEDLQEEPVAEESPIVEDIKVNNIEATENTTLSNELNQQINSEIKNVELNEIQNDKSDNIELNNKLVENQLTDDLSENLNDSNVIQEELQEVEQDHEDLFENVFNDEVKYDNSLQENNIQEENIIEDNNQDDPFENIFDNYVEKDKEVENDNENSLNNAGKDTENMVVVKRAGRPRKPVENIEPKEKRPAGRPKKPVENIEPKEKRPAGRPRKPIEDIMPKEKRPAGRPRKPVEDIMPKEKRPAGRPRKPVENIMPKEKRLAGRPKKVSDINTVEKKLEKAEQRLKINEMNIAEEINKVLNDNGEVNNDYFTIMNKISQLKKNAEKAKQSQSVNEIEEISEKIEGLLLEINNLNA